MPKKKPLLLKVTIGLPRSGKSTWARKQLRSKRGVAVVSPDEVRKALHGQAYVQVAEERVWATVELMVKALFRAGHKLVILDWTFNTKKRRLPWRGFQPWDTSEPGVLTEFVYFPASAGACVAQALKDERRDLVEVIERMAEQHEPPDVTETYEVVQPSHLPEDSDWHRSRGGCQETFDWRDEMTERERNVIRAAALISRGSSGNNGVQWAAQLLMDLLDGKGEAAQCPACEGSKVFYEHECSHCEGTGTADGMVQDMLQRRAVPETAEKKPSGG
jgi:predicted kinase